MELASREKKISFKMHALKYIYMYQYESIQIHSSGRTKGQKLILLLGRRWG